MEVDSFTDREILQTYRGLIRIYPKERLSI
jgi:hypothetical protein